MVLKRWLESNNKNDERRVNEGWFRMILLMLVLLARASAGDVANAVAGGGAELFNREKNIRIQVTTLRILRKDDSIKNISHPSPPLFKNVTHSSKTTHASELVTKDNLATA